MNKDIYVVSASVAFILVGFGLIIWMGARNSYLTFLVTAHWVSLILLIIAGILTWVSMVWMIHPSKFKVESKQWVSLGFSIFISVLWWARYAYTVSDAAEEAEEEESSLIS